MFRTSEQGRKNTQVSASIFRGRFVDVVRDVSDWIEEHKHERLTYSLSRYIDCDTGRETIQVTMGMEDE